MVPECVEQFRLARWQRFLLKSSALLLQEPRFDDWRLRWMRPAAGEAAARPSVRGRAEKCRSALGSLCRLGDRRTLVELLPGWCGRSDSCLGSKHQWGAGQ